MSNVKLLKMADMQLIDVTIKRHKFGRMGPTLRKNESSVVRQAMQWLAILWMALEEVRRDVETNCGKGVQGSKQNMV